MKKEVVIAIIVGCALGLIITFGIWSANRQMDQSLDDEATPTPTTALASPTPEAEEGFSLTIDSPPDNFLSDEEEISITGQTEPEAIIVLVSSGGEIILKADEEGRFETEVELEGGINEIVISAFSLEGEEAEKTLSLVYSTAEI